MHEFVCVSLQIRDSVNNIVSVLSRHKPTIKVEAFIGQSSSSRGRGLKQAEVCVSLLQTSLCVSVSDE
jgi:ERCC4-related helicase